MGDNYCTMKTQGGKPCLSAWLFGICQILSLSEHRILVPLLIISTTWCHK